MVRCAGIFRVKVAHGEREGFSRASDASGFCGGSGGCGRRASAFRLRVEQTFMGLALGRGHRV